MTQTTNKEKGKKEDKVLFSKKVVFEIREIDRYSEVLEVMLVGKSL